MWYVVVCLVWLSAACNPSRSNATIGATMAVADTPIALWTRASTVVIDTLQPSSTATVSQQMTATPQASLPLADLPDMKKSLDLVLASGGEWHAAIHGPDRTLLYDHQAEVVIHPASTIKIAIAMLVYKWLEGQDGGLEKNLLAGPIHAGRSYEQLLEAMLVSSEEDAAQKLQDAVVEGIGWKGIEQLLTEWGAPHTRLVPRRSTALDMSNLLLDIYAFNLPSPQGSHLILSLLAKQTAGDTVRLWKLKEVLPDGAVIYNKRGSLTDPVIVADVGIVVLPGKGPFYICIFGYSHGETIFEDLDKTIGRFALEWYKLESIH
jgi:hypothetical protein